MKKRKRAKGRKRYPRRHRNPIGPIAQLFEYFAPAIDTTLRVLGYQPKPASLKRLNKFDQL